MTEIGFRIKSSIENESILTGPSAGQMIKAIQNSSKNNIFPSNSVYAKDWSDAISYLGKKRHNKSIEDPDEMDLPRVYLPLDHPLEGRNNPQPSKPFIHWRVPSRFSDELHSEKLLQQIVADSGQFKIKRQHDLTQTTHFAPPFGKFQPIKSEQQDHMAEIHKQKEAMNSYLKQASTKFPRLPLSARLPQEKKKVSRNTSYSASQSMSNANRIESTNRSRTANIDQFFSKSGNPDAKKSFQSWFETATESDRKAALNFFANLSKKRASRRSEKIDYEYISENERRKQLTKVLNTLGKTRPQAIPPDPEVLLSLYQSTRALDKATERKHHRVYTPAKRFESDELKTWHHRPVHLYPARMNHVLSMYTLPNAPIPKDFKIHPEWEF